MGVPLTYVDTKGPMTDWFYTGSDGVTTDLLRAYLNGILIFEKALKLYLPCNPNYTSLNLRDFIDARNPNNLHFVTVYSTAGCIHPTLHSGDLSGFYVVLDISGSLQAGTPSSTAALALTSNLQVNLHNSGSILGYGGHGGRGKDGAIGSGGTTTTTKNEGPFYNGNYYWDVSCTPCHNSPNTTVKFKWGSTSGTVANCATCPGGTTHKSGSCTYYRGSVRSGSISNCAGGNTHGQCEIRRTCSTTVHKTGGSGGSGGAGGTGQYYKHAAKPGITGQTGSPGSHPESTRGETGGTGGAGGTWGNTGNPGGPSGTGSPGSTGGAAITGASRITNSDWNSSGGTIEGNIS